jgi:hypothetical protein
MTAVTPAAQADAMVSLIQATIATVLGPLMTELADNRRALTDLAGRIPELERENGQLTAELDTARRAHSPVASNLTPEPTEPAPPEPSSPFPWPLPPRPNVRALAPWLLLTAILGAAGVVLLVVVR